MARVYDSQIAWSASGKEATFKTAIAPTMQFNFDREQTPEIDAPQITDIDQYTGYDEPTTSQIPGITFPFSLAMARAKPDAVAFVFAMAMGKCTSAAYAATLTKAKRHLISRSEKTLLPSCTWERKQLSNYGETFSGAVCERAMLRMDLSRERFVTLESDWLAGKYAVDTSPTTPPGELEAGTANEEQFLEFLSGNMFFGTFANDTVGTNLDLATAADVTNWTGPNSKGGSQHLILAGLSYEYNNNIDRDQVFRYGEGLYPYEIHRGQVTETLSATFVKNSAFDHVAAVAANTNYSFEAFIRGRINETVSSVNGREGLRLQWPRVTMSNPRDSVVNNELRTTVDLAIKRKSSTVKASYVQVCNRRASYPNA